MRRSVRTVPMVLRQLLKPLLQRLQQKVVTCQLRNSRTEKQTSKEVCFLLDLLKHRDKFLSDMRSKFLIHFFTKILATLCIL